MEIASVANRTYDQLAGDGSHLRKTFGAGA